MSGGRIVIDWVMRAGDVSFRHAVKLLCGGVEFSTLSAPVPGGLRRPLRIGVFDLDGRPEKRIARAGDLFFTVRLRDLALGRPVPPREAYSRHLAPQGELEVVEVLPVPGKEEDVVVLAQPFGNSVPAREVLVAAIVQRRERAPATSPRPTS